MTKSKTFILFLGIAVLFSLSNCTKKSDTAPESAARTFPKELSSCQPCHLLDKGQAETVPGFGPGLKSIYNSAPVTEGIPFEKWDDASLDKWLSNPRDIKSNTKMTIRISDPEKRKSIIEALKTL